MRINNLSAECHSSLVRRVGKDKDTPSTQVNSILHRGRLQPTCLQSNIGRFEQDVQKQSNVQAQSGTSNDRAILSNVTIKAVHYCTSLVLLFATMAKRLHKNIEHLTLSIHHPPNHPAHLPQGLARSRWVLELEQVQAYYCSVIHCSVCFRLTKQ